MPQTGLKRHSEPDTGIPFSAASPVTYDWSHIPPAQPYAPGKNQGSSQSCTSQATGYGAFRFVGDISREDMYANTKLPGGGAYLVSPIQWLVSHGYLTLAQHPDPSPETEADMSSPTGASDAQRTKLVATVSVYSNPTIDQVAAAIAAHSACIIGIEYTDEGFAKGWTNPTFNPLNASGEDGHALHCVSPIKTSAGVNAIDCQSSWTGDIDTAGVASVHHEIDANFFAAGGVFELLTIDIIKETTMQLLQTPDKTIYLQTAKGIFGVGDEATYATFFEGETITQVEQLPSPELYTIGQGFVINPKGA